MGKRRRGPETYVRRGPTREPYDVVLIVCEGAKTEPNYFKRLKLAYRLSNANIHVLQAPGCDPMSIVQFAESDLQKGVYDKVFCVFDRDGHANFTQAIRRVEDSQPEGSENLLRWFLGPASRYGFCCIFFIRRMLSPLLAEDRLVRT
jgi:hypothetical protein